MPPERTGEDALLIGEVAASVGRSVHAIRWYCDQGLVPGLQRDISGRRVFTRRHVQWLALIERLRCTGMSIANIRRYTQLVSQGTATLEEQRTLLAGHRDQVAATIAGWHSALALIDAKLLFYEKWIASGKRPAGETAAGRSVGGARRLAAAPTPRDRRGSGRRP